MPRPTGSEEAGRLAERASLLRSIGRYREALPLVTRALALDPENAELLAEASLIHLCLGDARRGMRCAEQAAVADPAWYLPHRLRCLVLLAQGNAVQALFAARETVRLAPDEPEALRALVECHLTLNEAEEAEPLARYILRLEPESASSFLTLARVAKALNQWDRAALLANQALALDPECTEARLLLGGRLQKHGLTEEAARLYVEAGRITPGDEAVREEIGHLGDGFSGNLFLVYLVPVVALWFPLHLHGSLSGLLALLSSLALILGAIALLYRWAPRLLLAPQPGFRRLPPAAQSTIVESWRRGWCLHVLSHGVLLFLVACVALFFLTALYSAVTGTTRYLFDPAIHSPEGRRLAARRQREEAAERVRRDEERRRSGVPVDRFDGYEIRRIPPEGSHAEGPGG